MVARRLFAALVMIAVQFRIEPVTPLVPGSIPVAVCWRISRINASSRVAMSTFAEASLAVSCPSEAATRNAATVTINARPMIDTSKISDAPRSLLFRRKYVLVIVRSVQGYEQHSRMEPVTWIECECRTA